MRVLFPKPRYIERRAAWSRGPEFENEGLRSSIRSRRGDWLASAARFLVEIAVTLMAAYRTDRLKSGNISLLIGLLGKIGFSPNERGKMDLQHISKTPVGTADRGEQERWQAARGLGGPPRTCLAIEARGTKTLKTI
jgi:hypothetical protein